MTINITYERLKEDYMADFNNVKTRLTELMTQDLTMDSLKDLRDYFESILTNEGSSEGVISELEEYYNKCTQINLWDRSLIIVSTIIFY